MQTASSNCLCIGVAAHWLDDIFDTHSAEFIWHISATENEKV